LPLPANHVGSPCESFSCASGSARQMARRRFRTSAVRSRGLRRAVTRPPGSRRASGVRMRSRLLFDRSERVRLHGFVRPYHELVPVTALAVRGRADRSDLRQPEDRLELPKIALKIQEMSAAPGVQSLEQCSVAIRQQGTAADKVLPPIKVVGNSWISLLAYQTKGYAYIAP